MTRITEHQYRRLVARRSFLKGGAALAALPLLPWSEIAHAAEPYRLSLGDAEVSVVSDGELTLPLEMLSPDATPEQLVEIARTMGWTDGKAHPSANIPLIRMGDDLILVDTGSGNRFAPTAGKLMENLAATGVEPGAITRVVFTHAHPDHVWGTVL
jgi:glyoxylase-like metal-dependent hydrolase (beta-lactamase superfamily II)